MTRSILIHNNLIIITNAKCFELQTIVMALARPYANLLRLSSQVQLVTLSAMLNIFHSHSPYIKMKFMAQICDCRPHFQKQSTEGRTESYFSQNYTLKKNTNQNYLSNINTSVPQTIVHCSSFIFFYTVKTKPGLLFGLFLNFLIT